MKNSDHIRELNRRVELLGRDLTYIPGRPAVEGRPYFVTGTAAALIAPDALGDLGLRVPQDVSVAGIDDFPWAAAFRPALTVVEQPIAAMAQAAFEALTARLSGAEGPPLRQVFAPRLLIRESCRACER